jgi:hypothetical protein
MPDFIDGLTRCRRHQPINVQMESLVSPQMERGDHPADAE